jgi:hypothetical protein
MQIKHKTLMEDYKLMNTKLVTAVLCFGSHIGNQAARIRVNSCSLCKLCLQNNNIFTLKKITNFLNVKCMYDVKDKCTLLISSDDFTDVSSLLRRKNNINNCNDGKTIL